MQKTGLLLLISSLTLGAQAIVQHSVAAAAGTVAGTVAGKKISDSLNGVSKVSESAAQSGADKKSQSSSKPTNQNKQAKSTKEEKAPVAAAGAKPAEAKTDVAGQKNSASSGGAETTTSQPPARAAKAGPRAPAPISKADSKASAAPAAGADGDATANDAPAPRVVARKPAARRKARPKKVEVAATPVIPMAPAALVPAEEPIKDITEIPVGTTRQALLGKLGRPVSRVSMPEEDGLKEIFTYARNGYGWGTVRLKNGVVIEVERRQ